VPAKLEPARLKEYMYNKLHRKIQEETGNYQFRLDDFELCGPGYCDLEKRPNQPALRSFCVQEKMTLGKVTEHFKRDMLVEAYLIIKKPVWHRLEVWMEEIMVCTICRPTQASRG
jgi:hypothetical protein